MAITSRDQMIDTATISKGCDIIDQAIQDYAKCAKYIQDAASIWTADVLAVQKQSMQPVLEELAEVVKKIPADVENLTAKIRTAALQVYSQQEDEYNNYMAQQQAAANNTASGTTTSSSI